MHVCLDATEHIQSAPLCIPAGWTNHALLLVRQVTAQLGGASMWRFDTFSICKGIEHPDLGRLKPGAEFTDVCDGMHREVLKA